MSLKTIVVAGGLTFLTLFGCDSKPSGSGGGTISLGGGGTNTATTNKDLVLDTGGNRTDPKEAENGSKTKTNEKTPEKKPEDTGLKLDPNASEAAQKGMTLLMAEKPGDAFEVWTEAVEKRPEDTNSLLCLAQYYWDDGAEEEAIQLIQKFYDAKPSDHLKTQVAKVCQLNYKGAIGSFSELQGLMGKKGQRKELETQIAELKRQIRVTENQIKDNEKMQRSQEVELFTIRKNEQQTRLEELEADLRNMK